MDKLTALTVFRRVAELESFSGAARELGLSNTAVSKNVRELEAALGARLIHRTTRRLHLTAAGEDYYRRAAAILDELAAADAAVMESSDAPRGLLRVSAPMSLGLTLLAPAVGEFLATYPELRVELELNDRKVDLIREGFDVALRGGGPLADSSLVARKLMPLDRYVCGSPGYFERHPEPERPEDLAHHRCLIYSLSDQPTRWTFRRGPTTRSVDIAGPLRVNSSLALVSAAVAGAGLAWVPAFAVEQELQRKTLRPVLREWQSEPQALYVLFPQHQQTSHKVRRFIDWLAGRFSGPRR